MRRTSQILLSLILLCITAFAHADDKVRIRYLPGYPLPGQSSERVDVRVERTGHSAKAGDQDVDRFFDLVRATLFEYRIDRDWQIAVPDAPSIEISIDLNGHQLRLVSAHIPVERSANLVVTERGIEALNRRARDAVLSEQSEEFRRHRLAFDRLLELTLARTRARLSPAF
jgi:hypothetical protein